MIQLPKKNIIQAPKCGVMGTVGYKVFNERTGHTRLDVPLVNKNMLLTAGLEEMMAGKNIMTTYAANCSIGTGNTPPSVVQTQLQQLEATSPSIASTNYDSGTAPWWHANLRTYRFYADSQSLAGKALTELGPCRLNPQGGGPNLARSLIRDGAGNPTSITLIAGEVLEIYYELRTVPPTADSTGTMTLNTNSGTETFNWTIRPINIQNTAWSPAQAFYIDQAFVATSQALVSNTDTSVPGTISSHVLTVNPYITSSLEYSSNLSLSLTEGNDVGGLGIGSLILAKNSSQRRYQMSFSNQVGGGTIPKDATKTFSYPNVITMGIQAL